MFCEIRFVVARSITEPQAASAHHSAILSAGTRSGSKAVARGNSAPDRRIDHVASIQRRRKKTNSAVHSSAWILIGISHSSKNGYPNNASRDPKFESAYSRYGDARFCVQLDQCCIRGAVVDSRKNGSPTATVNKTMMCKTGEPARKIFQRLDGVRGDPHQTTAITVAANTTATSHR